MILFFDVETTGLPKNWDAPITETNNWPRIVQLAYLIFDDHGNKLSENNFIIKPNGYEIPSESSKLHGITTDKAATQGQNLETILHQFSNYIDDANLIVGYNLSFIENVVLSEFFRLGIQNRMSDKRKICIMKNTVNFCKINGSNGYKWPKLEELYLKVFGEKLDNFYNALSDVQNVAKCFWELKSKGIIIYENYKNQTVSNQIIKLTKPQAGIKQIPNPNLSIQTDDPAFKAIETMLNKSIKKGQGDDVRFLLSSYYPFDLETIKMYEDILSFEKLSSNNNIIWTDKLLDYYIKKWDWLKISINIRLSFEQIRKYEDYLQISSKVEFFDPFHRINHGGISRNENIEWDTEILDYYAGMLTWSDLCKVKAITWSEKIIDKYIDYIDWSELSYNPTLEWDEFLIGKYFNKIDWEQFSRNTSLFENIQLIKKYENKWNWSYLSQNTSIKWTLEILNQFKLKIDWHQFAHYNKYNSETFNTFKDFILVQNNWPWVFSNKNIEWDSKLLKEVQHLIVGENRLFISRNLAIKWSIELIDEFNDILDWNELSSNESLPWSADLIIRYKDKWNRNLIAKNRSIPWYKWDPDLNDFFSINSNLFELTSIEWFKTFIDNYINYIVLARRDYELRYFLTKHLNNNLLKIIAEDSFKQVEKKINESPQELSKKNKTNRFYAIMYYEFMYKYISKFDDIHSINKQSFTILLITKKGRYFVFNSEKHNLNIENRKSFDFLTDLIQIERDDDLLTWHRIDHYNFNSYILILTRKGILKKLNLFTLIKSYDSEETNNSLCEMDEVLALKIINLEDQVFLTSRLGSISKVPKNLINSNSIKEYFIGGEGNDYLDNIFVVENSVKEIFIIYTDATATTLKTAEIPSTIVLEDRININDNYFFLDEKLFFIDNQIVSISKFETDFIIIVPYVQSVKGMEEHTILRVRMDNLNKNNFPFPKRNLKLISNASNRKILKILI